MLKLLIACAVVALAVAVPYEGDKDKSDYHPGVERPYGFPYVYPYVPHPAYYPGHYYGYPYGYGQYYHRAPHHGAFVYVGSFPGSCHGAADGLYYVDENNFAFCSNGIKSIQKCAEGSANRPLEYFHPGNHYSYVDFCSVNLSDFDKAH